MILHDSHHNITDFPILQGCSIQPLHTDYNLNLPPAIKRGRLEYPVERGSKGTDRGLQVKKENMPLGALCGVSPGGKLLIDSKNVPGLEDTEAME